MSGNSGTDIAADVHIVYMGDFSSAEDMNSTCRKMIHTRMLVRGFTLIVFSEYLRIWSLMFVASFVCFLEIQVYSREV